MSSSCLDLLFFLDGSFGSVSGSILSHLLDATTGADCISHLDDDDLVSRFRSRRTTGDEDPLIGIPSKSSDTNKRPTLINMEQLDVELIMITWNSIDVAVVFARFGESRWRACLQFDSTSQQSSSVQRDT